MDAEPRRRSRVLFLDVVVEVLDEEELLVLVVLFVVACWALETASEEARVRDAEEEEDAAAGEMSASPKPRLLGGKFKGR